MLTKPQIFTRLLMTCLARERLYRIAGRTALWMLQQVMVWVWVCQREIRRSWRLGFTVRWAQSSDPFETITVTGHSLGGGLAGLVGAIYGKKMCLIR